MQEGSSGPETLRKTETEQNSKSMALRPVTVNEDYDDGDLTMLRAISAGFLYVQGPGMIPLSHT